MAKVFFWRKLHSLSGIIPLGVFIMVHMFINSTAVLGPENFNRGVTLLHGLPYLWFWELVLIFLPMAYHAGYGLWLVWLTKNNIRSYPYVRNGLFYWQRISALITLLFVAWHVAVLRFSEGVISSISFDFVMKTLNQPMLLTLYVIGLLASFSHFANGIWSFLVSWGVTVGEQAQRTAGYCCLGVFIILTAVGMNALLAFI